MQIFFLVLFLFPAFATAGSNGGSDSCGLAWQVAKGKTLVGTSTRGTTHSISPPTFSMTSGTSGCDKHSIAQNEIEAARFAVNNRDSLEEEITAGQGEYVDNFAKTLRCDAVGQANLGGVLQDHYSEVMDESDLIFFVKIKEQIRQSPALKDHCLT